MLGPANFGNVQPLDRKEKRTADQANPHERLTEEERLRQLNTEYNGSLAPKDRGGVPPSGTLDFVLHKDSAVAAKFVVVEHSADPIAVARIVTDVWRLPTPSVVLSVTGAATALDITPQLESDFVDGLRVAAQSADAWIFTGGTDAGVMSLTGKALIGGSGQRTPCIGVTSWRKVMHKESIYAKLEINRREDAEHGAFTMTAQKKRLRGGGLGCGHLAHPPRVQGTHAGPSLPCVAGTHRSVRAGRSPLQSPRVQGARGALCQVLEARAELGQERRAGPAPHALHPDQR